MAKPEYATRIETLEGDVSTVEGTVSGHGTRLTAVESVASAARTTANAALPKAGGTMTGIIKKEGGTILQNTSDSAQLFIDGVGSQIILTPKNHTDGGAIAQIGVRNTADSTNLWFALKHDGTIKWNGKEVECVSESGTGYVRYASGLQICWGTGSWATGSTWTFPKAFSAAPRVVVSTRYNSTTNAYITTTATVSSTGASFVVCNFMAAAYSIRSTDGPTADAVAVGTWA